MTKDNAVKTILISGASIAGPALAWWLTRHGFRPTLIERSSGPRPGGHAIDVRGAAINVLRAMGLEAATRERRTALQGLSILDAEGAEVWRSQEMTISGGSFDAASIEILRDDMSDVLLSALPETAEIIYGDSVAELELGDAGATVTFERAPPRRFDLVVGADGIGSHTRKLVFGTDQDCIRPFGFALAAYSAPNHLGLKDWQLSYELGGGERCLIYTARENQELRVCLAFAAAFADVPSDRAGQLALVFVAKNQAIAELSLDERFADPDYYTGVIEPALRDTQDAIELEELSAALNSTG
jgi:2-polyprenyl-6-methoxyphenol hydroxylase-like FAD-dependent oxidoreductase